jgi:hypothetical protein
MLAHRRFGDGARISAASLVNATSAIADIECHRLSGAVSAGRVSSRTVRNRDVSAGAPRDGFTAFREEILPAGAAPATRLAADAIASGAS